MHVFVMLEHSFNTIEITLANIAVDIIYEHKAVLGVVQLQESRLLIGLCTQQAVLKEIKREGQLS